MKKILLLCLLVAGPAHAALVREGSFTLGTIGIGAAVIDPSSDFAYFIDTGALTLSLSPPVQHTTIEQVNLSNFSEAGNALYSSTFTTPAAPIQNAAIIDPAGGFAYFTFGQSTGTIVKYHLPDFTQVSSTTLSITFGHLSCGVIDPTASYAYFGTDTNPAQIVKIDLTNLAVISSMTLPAPNANLRSAVIDTQNHFAYFGSSTTPGNVTKINLTNFSFVKTLSFNSGEGGAISTFLDATAGYIWFGTNDSPGRVVRIQLNTFTENANTTLTLQANENKLSSVLYDSVSRKAYFGTFTSTGTVVRISAIAMARDTALILNTGEAYLASGVMDSDSYGYFGTMTNPGQIVKVDLLGGPPEIDLDPADQDVAVGQSATFSVSATGRNLAYQWNRDNTAIAGATQTTYQLANVALTDDGATFSCTVSNSSGTVTTRNALLTAEPDIHVYPNPWRANRHAGIPVTFNEIPPGANVEIFTLAAQWVKTVPENGGIATWDLRNNAGQNAASGYYFYYVKTSNDRQTLRGKFAIIR